MSSITREKVLQMPLDAVFAAVKDPKTSADMQLLLRDRQVATHISNLMIERQNRESEVDRQLERTPPTTAELAEEARTMASQPEAAPAVLVPAVLVQADSVVSPQAESVQSPVVQPAQSVTAEWEADNKAWAEEGVSVTRDASGKITRMVQEYQVRDDDGTPIGRPTHLEARNPQELLSKQRVAHENATRAFYRLKKQKLTFKQEHPQILTPEQIKELATKALEEKDITKVEGLLRAKVEGQYTEREKAVKAKEDYETGRAISNEFMRRHLHDYNPCEANQKLIGEYFVEHNLEFTLDNLEAAFTDLMEQGKLVKVEKTITPKPAEAAPNTQPTATPAPATDGGTPVAAQPAVVTPPVVAPATAQPVASQPVAEATVTTPAVAPNAQPAARRPGVNGSIAPGTMSAHRPGAPDPALARKEFMKQIKNMDPEVMKTKLRSDPQFVKQCESYGIRVR